MIRWYAPNYKSSILLRFSIFTHKFSPFLLIVFLISAEEVFVADDAFDWDVVQFWAFDDFVGDATVVASLRYLVLSADSQLISHETVTLIVQFPLLQKWY